MLADLSGLMPARKRVSCRIINVDLIGIRSCPAADGGYCAQCRSENIFTSGGYAGRVRKKVVEAATALVFVSYDWGGAP
jgi:hypothetical protein